MEKYGQENRISGKLSIPKKPIPISTEYCLVQNLTRDKVVEIKDWECIHLDRFMVKNNF